MKITKLEVESFKRVKAVRITPDGGAIVLGGENGVGKSSVLDAIEAAIGGAKHAPDEPVRKGAKAARVVLETEEFTVTRKWSAKGGAPSVEVKSKDGSPYPSPQALLDGLVGKLSFDPLAFSRMKTAEQAETLRKLVGLDFAKEDAARAEAFAKRTDVGRELRRLQGALEKMPEAPEKTPDAEVSVAELAAEMQRRQEVNSANALKRSQLATMRGDAMSAKATIARKEQEVERLEAEAARLRLELVDHWRDFNAMNEAGMSLAAEVKALVDEALDDVKQRIANAEEVNRAVRAKAERAKLEAELDAATEESERLTRYLGEVDAVKADAAAKASYPVPGLVVTDAGVELAGVPFEQASQAEKLRASVAIGLALNPQLKVLLIRDGALLDKQSLALVSKMAEEHGGQVWLEVVGNRDEVTVLIEDGEVAAEPDARQPATGVA